MYRSTTETLRRALRFPSDRVIQPSDSDLLYTPVVALARAAHSVSPDTRLGTVLELLKASSYRFVPVVRDGELLGIVREADLFSVLYSAPDRQDREAIIRRTAGDYMTEPPALLTTWMTPREAAAILQRGTWDALPVVDPPTRRFVAILDRTDLVAEMHRAIRPPTVGGMATPIGVHLTSGAYNGGVGARGLILTGLLLFTLQVVAFGASAILSWALSSVPALSTGSQFAALPASMRVAIPELIVSLVQISVFLLLLRTTSVVSYHAAEHQVVHAIERGEPLLVPSVRQMPRVHPRCGTNLASGAMIFSAGQFVAPFLGPIAYALSALAAMLYWRKFGAWVQQNLTTRPASDAQLTQAISAAQSLLTAQRNSMSAANSGTRAVSRWTRIWNSGILQIMVGFLAGYSCLLLLALLCPPVAELLLPTLREIAPVGR